MFSPQSSSKFHRRRVSRPSLYPVRMSVVFYSLKMCFHVRLKYRGTTCGNEEKKMKEMAPRITRGKSGTSGVTFNWRKLLEEEFAYFSETNI